MNSARAVKPATGNIRGDVTGQLPTDASAKVFNALILKPRAIFKRFKSAERLSTRLRNDILDYHHRPDRRLPDRNAVINELVSLREQLVDDFDDLTELLSTPAPLHQFEAIAALAARGFNRSDLDEWLASVYAAVTCPEMFEESDPVPISGSVLAEAIRSLGRENKFRPTGVEIYESCQQAYNSMSKLRESIRGLVEAPPPHLNAELKKIVEEEEARQAQLKAQIERSKLSPAQIEYEIADCMRQLRDGEAISEEVPKDVIEEACWRLNDAAIR